MRKGQRIAPFALAAVATFAATWAWASLGDYPTDGGRSIAALLGGHLHAFLAGQPAMGPLSLYLRFPFAALAGSGALDAYRWGALPCVAAVALLGVWLARIARSRGAGPVGQAAIVLLSVFNPLVESALELGHPEELLTAALCVAALLAASQRRVLATATLLGLGLASKQWSAVLIAPVLLALPRRRSAALAWAAAIAAALSLPMLIDAPGAFVHNQISLAHEHYLSPALFSWLWPWAPSVTKLVSVEHLGTAVSLARLPAWLVGLLHPAIVTIPVIAALALWRNRRGHPSIEDVLALAALALVLRCALDTETMPYYHAALLMVFLAWDALDGRRFPLRALTAAAAAYLLFDVLPGYATVDQVNFFYDLVTVPAALALGRALAKGAGTAIPALTAAPARHAAPPVEAAAQA
jgi:hypothetical protein